jgi:hypothetical protein
MGLIILVLAAGALILFVIREKPPHSLAEAITKRKDEFPKNSYVLVPPADLQRLGEVADILDDRRARPTGTKCFDVAPITGAGLKKIELSYQSSAEFRAEIAEVATKAGGELRSDDQATVVFEDLRVVEGIGVPILGSACGFKNGTQNADVITATVVAGKAEIEFSRNISFETRGKDGWGNGSASGSVAGSDTQAGQLQGTNIVVVGVVTPVAVTLTKEERDLGTTLVPGTVITFPAGFEGNVSIDALQTDTEDRRPVLGITAHTRMSASPQNVPAGLKPCAVDQSISLRPGEICFVWNQTGASGVQVWFEPRTVNDASHIVLHLDGYSTTFAPSRQRKPEG